MRASTLQIKNMKVGDVFIHPFAYSGIGAYDFFKITEIGPDSSRFGKFNKIMYGERWHMSVGDIKPHYLEKDSIWAGNLTNPVPLKFKSNFIYSKRTNINMAMIPNTYVETIRRVYCDDKEYQNAFFTISPENCNGSTLNISSIESDEATEYWGKINFTISLNIAEALANAILAEIVDIKNAHANTASTK
jgi:hypothetical protein